MTIKENLIAAKALIPDNAHWLRGGYRLNDCYCTLGAVSAALGVKMGDGDHSREAMALRLALQFGHSIVQFNDFDAQDVSEVHALFDRAIEAQP